jgi:hypothetical protein
MRALNFFPDLRALAFLFFHFRRPPLKFSAPAFNFNRRRRRVNAFAFFVSINIFEQFGRARGPALNGDAAIDDKRPATRKRQAQYYKY